MWIVHGAGDRCAPSRSRRRDRAIASSALSRSRVRRQAEIVVRGEIDDLTVIEGALVALFAFGDMRGGDRALLLERVKLAGEVIERVGPHKWRVPQAWDGIVSGPDEQPKYMTTRISRPATPTARRLD